MSAKTSADVLIGGKIYTLSGYESEDYLQKVANYINSKINEFDEMEQFRRFPGEMKSTLVELNIADDYFKAKEQAEKLDQDVKEKEKEIYDLKHELISARIKVESCEKMTTELEKENRRLLLHKAKLETALEDALLGKVKGQVLPEEIPSGKGKGQNLASGGSAALGIQSLPGEKQTQAGGQNKQEEVSDRQTKRAQDAGHKDKKKHPAANNTENNESGRTDDRESGNENVEKKDKSI